MYKPQIRKFGDIHSHLSLWELQWLGYGKAGKIQIAGMGCYIRTQGEACVVMPTEGEKTEK